MRPGNVALCRHAGDIRVTNVISLILRLRANRVDFDAPVLIASWNSRSRYGKLVSLTNYQCDRGET
jgi:hypothetical protein